MARRILAIMTVLLMAIPAVAGTWTANNFLYKPSLGARGEAEKNTFDSGLDRIDARLGKEVWVGDPGYGTTLQDAISATGSDHVILRVPAGSHTIDADLTVPANITLKAERGATFAVASPKTLTLNGGFEAGLYQVFSCAGTGKVVFGSGSVAEVYPEWWGIDGTNDEVQIQAAVDSLPGGGTVVFAGGRTYNVQVALLEYDYNHSPADDYSYVAVEVKYSNTRFLGKGGTIKIAGGTSPGTPGDHLNYIFGSRKDIALANIVYENLIFDLNKDGGANHRGVMGMSTTGLHFKGCKFYSSNTQGGYGIVLYNCADVSVDGNCLFSNLSGGVAAIYSSNLRIEALFDGVNEAVDLDKMNRSAAVGGIIRNTSAGAGNAGIDSNATVGLNVTTVFQNVAATNINFSGKDDLSDTWAHWVAGTDKAYRPGIGLRVNSTWYNCAYAAGQNLISIGDNWADTPNRTTQHGCRDVVVSGSGYQTGCIWIKEGTGILLNGLVLEDVVTPAASNVGGIYIKSEGDWTTYPYAEVYGEVDVTLNGVTVDGVTRNGLYAVYPARLKINGCSFKNCNTSNTGSPDVQLVSLDKRNAQVEITGNSLYAGAYAYRGLIINGSGGTYKATVKGNRIHGTYGSYKFQTQGDAEDHLEAEQVLAHFGTAAAGTTVEKPILVAPSNCYVFDVFLINAANIPQNDTNYENFNVRNRGSTGAGTTTIQALNTKATGGVAINAFDAVSMGFAVTEADAYLARDDVLSLLKTPSGSGQGTTDLQVGVRYVEY